MLKLVDKSDAFMFNKELPEKDLRKKIFKELMKIIENDEEGAAFENLDREGILKELFPDIDGLKTVGKCKYHCVNAYYHMNDVYKVYKELINGTILLKDIDTHILDERIGDIKIKEYLALAAFAHDIGKYRSYKKEGDRISFILHDRVGGHIMEEVCDRLLFPIKAKKLIVEVINGHMYPLQLFSSKLKYPKKSFYKFFSIYDKYVEYILMISYCDIYATTMYSDPENEREEYRKFIENLLSEYSHYKQGQKNSH